MKPQTILVIGDTVNTVSLKENLSGNFTENSVVTFVPYSQELNAYLQLDPDVVIIDCCTNKSDGIQISKYFRKHMVNVTIPIVLMLNRNSDCIDELSDVMRKSAADDFVFYPTDSKELALRIKHLFSSKRNEMQEKKVSVDLARMRQMESEHKNLQALLQQSQKMEAIGTLAGGIAHDFNNILFPIMGYTEMAMGLISEKSRAYYYLREIIKGSQRAKELVEQILSFSRQNEAERMPLKIQPMIKEVMKFMRSSLPTTIEIRQNIEKECQTILCDPTQIHQILMNLCTNAYHAMEASGGILEISLKQADFYTESETAALGVDAGTYAILSVKDTGCGMDKVTMMRIFDPYFTTKDAGKGTGLGLSVIHGIVKSHSGSIHVESRPDHGTVFTVYLPVVQAEDLNTPMCLPQQLPQGNETILFVDDESQITKMMERLLEDLGYRVHPFTNSKAALQAFQQNPNIFDLVITDQTMPAITGIELSKNMMRIRPEIPIIICTGFSEFIDDEKAKRIGIREYVKKPIIKEQLAKMIRKILDNNTSADVSISRSNELECI